MRIYDLECLLIVARAKSISKAAKELFVGQTTLSAIIRSLEKELSVQLFKRTPSGLILTSKGEEAVAIASDIVQRAHSLETLSSTLPVINRTVYFLAYLSACDFLMVYLTSKIQQEDLMFSFQAINANSRNMLSKLKKTEANIGVGSTQYDVFSNIEASASLEGYEVEALYEDYFCLCVSAKSSYAQREKLEIEDIQDEYFAVVEHYPFYDRKPVFSEFESIRKYAVFYSFDGIKKAICRNQMVGLIPSLELHNDFYIDAGLIKSFPLSSKKDRLVNYIIYPKNDFLTHEERIFIKFIKEFYAKIPYSGEFVER